MSTLEDRWMQSAERKSVVAANAANTAAAANIAAYIATHNAWMTEHEGEET